MAGSGHRIPCAAILAASDASATLRDVLLRFAQVLMVQTTYSVLANAVHHVDERLARWLLMCHDRSDSDDLALTHVFMALMLSVRRPSVTTALHVLEGNGFIRSDRGYVTIRDRVALEAFAGDCYGKPGEGIPASSRANVTTDARRARADGGEVRRARPSLFARLTFGDAVDELPDYEPHLGIADHPIARQQLQTLLQEERLAVGQLLVHARIGVWDEVVAQRVQDASGSPSILSIARNLTVSARLH